MGDVGWVSELNIGTLVDRSADVREVLGLCRKGYVETDLGSINVYRIK